jgi:hypothetical protein
MTIVLYFCCVKCSIGAKLLVLAYARNARSSWGVSMLRKSQNGKNKRRTPAIVKAKSPRGGPKSITAFSARCRKSDDVSMMNVL